MLSLTVEGDRELVADFTRAPAGVTRASIRALNRAIASGRTVMVREMAKDLGLKQQVIREAMPIREATERNVSAQFGANLKRIPLIAFSARGPEPSRGRGRGVTYRLPGGRGRFPTAFIATMRSGHKGVFVRIGKKRLGIRELFGPSLGHVFRKFKPIGVTKTQDEFEKRFQHEMDREDERQATRVVRSLARAS